jgi:hypothetical protein
MRVESQCVWGKWGWWCGERRGGRCRNMRGGRRGHGSQLLKHMLKKAQLRGRVGNGAGRGAGKGAGVVTAEGAGAGAGAGRVAGVVAIDVDDTGRVRIRSTAVNHVALVAAMFLNVCQHLWRVLHTCPSKVDPPCSAGRYIQAMVAPSSVPQ